MLWKNVTTQGNQRNTQEVCVFENYHGKFENGKFCDHHNATHHDSMIHIATSIAASTIRCYKNWDIACDAVNTQKKKFTTKSVCCFFLHSHNLSLSLSPCVYLSLHFSYLIMRSNSDVLFYSIKKIPVGKFNSNTPCAVCMLCIRNI